MDIRKLDAYKKFDALEDFDLNANLLILQEITSKWYKARPDNEDLILLKNAVLSVTIIANKMNYEKKLYFMALAEYKQDKLRAIERARKLEEQLNQVKTEKL